MKKKDARPREPTPFRILNGKRPSKRGKDAVAPSARPSSSRYAVRIPFNRPFLTGWEFTYIQDVIQTTHLSGGGPYSEKCQDLLKESLGVAGALLTTSCTHALEMAALLLDIRSGDEVILPSFTFVSTVNAFALRGAVPVFADIRRDTLNLDESLIEERITPRTKAIVAVHYAGVGCAMDAIMDIAERHRLAVVEDNAHGLFGSYRRRLLGTFGSLATLSFHDTKNFTCGEGGALLINDPLLTDRAEIIREKGTDRTRFFRGQVDKYTWVDLGSSYLPSEILAAYLYAQLGAREEIQTRRRRIWDYYRDNLADWADTRGVRLPTVPMDCEQAYHMFYLLLPDQRQRDSLIAHLRRLGIAAVFHYVPLHSSKMGRQYGCSPESCPVTSDLSSRLVRLPFFSDLKRGEQEEVVEAVRAF